MAVPFPMTFWGIANTEPASANPQLQFFENFPGKNGANFQGNHQLTMLVHAVNIPLSISFNSVVVLGVHANTASRTKNISFGLYSMNGSTLSLANSAFGSWALSGTATSWIGLSTSATQNITPGAWYFGLLQSINTAGSGSSFGLWGNSSLSIGSAPPAFVMGSMTASNSNLPASVATSEISMTGTFSNRQHYIIITA